MLVMTSKYFEKKLEYEKVSIISTAKCIVNKSQTIKLCKLYNYSYKIYNINIITHCYDNGVLFYNNFIFYNNCTL